MCTLITGDNYVIIRVVEEEVYYDNRASNISLDRATCAILLKYIIFIYIYIYIYIYMYVISERL
jgi:hypothetical protein